MKKGIVEVLVKARSYEPADDITINIIVQSAINFNKIGLLLNSTNLTEYTCARVSDAQLKQVKIIYDGLQLLGISCLDRLKKGLTAPDYNKTPVGITKDDEVITKFLDTLPSDLRNEVIEYGQKQV